MNVATADTDRIERERRFHDDRFATAGGDGEERDRFYEFVAGARERLAAATSRFEPGDRVLEIGVGLASTGWDLARMGVDVVAIDISPVAVDRARSLAAEERLSTIRFDVMNAEDLSYDDDTFDGVVGSGILHHLDLERAYAEVSRVLRPDGHAVFYEPLGHNPAINRYRDRTPHMRTDDEHPLRHADLATARRYFGEIEMSMHHCLVIGCAFLPKRVVGWVHPVVDRVDRVLLRLPGVRWMAWISVMELSRPR